MLLVLKIDIIIIIRLLSSSQAILPEQGNASYM